MPGTGECSYFIITLYKQAYSYIYILLLFNFHASTNMTMNTLITPIALNSNSLQCERIPMLQNVDSSDFDEVKVIKGQSNVQ